jgi:hypothetical protein
MSWRRSQLSVFVDLQGFGARLRDNGENTARPQVNHVPPKLFAQYAAMRTKLAAEPESDAERSFGLGWRASIGSRWVEC